MQQRVDWFRLIDDLKRRGYSTYALEMLTGVPKSTLLGYKQGAEPKHLDGERLIGVWCQVTGLQRDSIPTEPVQLSAAKAKAKRKK